MPNGWRGLARAIDVTGSPEQARWLRDAPRRSVPGPILDRIVQAAFPDSRVVGSELLAGGLRNANFKLHLDRVPEPVVLSIYEHDASLCQKEIDLMRLIRGSVPVPEVIYAEPDGSEELPPFRLTRWVDGITFHELKRSGDLAAIADAARAAGETLADIGRFTFDKGGWLTPGPTVGSPLLAGADAVPRFVDLCLASDNLQARTPAELRARAHATVWSWAPRLAALERTASLVHGDFNKRNLLVHPVGGRWKVAAVLDWEFAVSGSPLTDLANFLRYERAGRPLAEPYFSDGYRSAGGHLPDDWRQLAKIVDLAALCESLTHDQLPESVVAELVELVRATIEDPWIMST